MLEIHPVAQDAGHHLGLFVYLLEHEVAVAALVDQHVFRGYGLQPLVDEPAIQVAVFDAFPGYLDHLPGVEEANFENAV